MILQEDRRFALVAPFRSFFEFAFVDGRLERVTSELEFDRFCSVQPMLDVLAADDDAALIPFARRFRGGVSGRRKDIVKPGGFSCAVVQLGIRMFRVIEQLIFAADSFIRREQIIFQSAVGAGCETPFPRKLEVIKLCVGDNVAAAPPCFMIRRRKKMD